MSRFRVTAHIKASISGGYATLDALLAALLFDRLDDVEAAHAAVPLANTNGLFHASAAIYEHIDIGRTTFVASLRAQHDLDPDLIRKNKAGTGPHRSISTKREREFGNVFIPTAASQRPRSIGMPRAMPMQCWASCRMLTSSANEERVALGKSSDGSSNQMNLMA